MPLRLPRFERTVVLTDKEGRPNLAFHRWWQEFARNIESSFNQLETIVLDIQAAQTAAETAQAAAETAQAAADAAYDLMSEKLIEIAVGCPFVPTERAA